MTEASQVTYEDGYETLKLIVSRLDADDVSVHEMCELFARGKGLEKALRSYLVAQQGKLDEIEAGENLPAFTIVAPSAPAAEPPRPAASPEAEAFGLGGFAAAAEPAGDDDIPF